MEGFVEKPSLEELVQLGRQTQVPVFIDQGTGLLQIPTTGASLTNEMTFARCIAQGCDLIAASGDKLLGGPQCGIVAGRKDLIERVRKAPLFRTYRADKLVYAALEATLAAYSAHISEQIPIVRMLCEPAERIRQRCEAIAAKIDAPGVSVAVVAVESVIGGGTAPKTRLDSHALALRKEGHDATALLRDLRRSDPPVIARIEDDRVVLDLRTIEPCFDSSLAKLLNDSFSAGRSLVDQ
jgi:L-seryl-tRNA(Ser) seleniumtransferase